MAETNPAPSPNFSTIDFNPSFFTSSTYLTVDEADSLYLNKSVPDTANVLETFSVGISANTIQAGSVTVTTVLNSDSVDSSGTTLTLGATNATKVTTSKPFSASSFDSTGSTLTLGVTNATTVTTSLPFYANSYYFTGTAPTLSKTSMNYFVNYSAVAEGFTTTGARYLYTPASNSAGASHYFNAGVYEANVHVYVVQTGGPTFSGCTFTIGAASGTATGTISKTSQYGTYNVTSPTFSAANPGGVNFNGNGFVLSHTGCFTLASSAFINLELYIGALTAITAGTVTFSIYGCVKRIA